MAARTTHLLTHLRRLASGDADTEPDAVLLDRFVRDRDEAAFAAVVARHGPMVLRLCRRALGDVQAAEDAFQAAFLILARRAETIRRRASLAAWLHGVAHRVALKARTSQTRRQRRAVTGCPDRADPRPDPLERMTARELLAALDDEVARLPEAYRLPVILCGLEGKTLDEAARQLGWTPGQVKGRLERGRKRLHARLARRGLAAPAALAAVEFARTAGAAVRAGFAQDTARAAVGFAAGRGAAVGVSARALTLARAGLREAALARAGATALVALTLGLLVAGASAFGRTIPGDEGAVDPKPAAAVEDEPQVGKPGVDRYGDALPPGAVARLGTTRLRSTASVLALAPDGKTLLTVAGGRTLGRVDAASGLLLGEKHLPGLPGAFTHTCLASDGRTVAVADGKQVEVWDTTTGRQLRVLKVEALTAALTPGGRLLATAEYQTQGVGGVRLTQGVGRIRLWDLATGKDRLLAVLPSYANALAFGPGGKRLFAAVDNHSLRCWETASGGQVWQNDFWASHLIVSPDGRTVCTDTYLGGRLHLWDARDGRKRGSLGEGRPWTASLAFSPDGTLIAQGMSKEVVLWDVGGGKVRHQAVVPLRTAEEVALWDVAAGKVRHRLPSAGWAVAFASDGRSCFTLGPLLLRWDVDSGRLLYADTRAHGHSGAVGAVLFTPDGRTLVSSGGDGTTRVWQLADGSHRILPTRPVTLARPGWGGHIWLGEMGRAPVELTPDGRRLLTHTGDGEVALVDVATGKVLRGFRLPDPGKDKQRVIAAARLSEDGRVVLAVGHTYATNPGSSIRLQGETSEPVRGWDVATGKEVLTGTAPCPGPLAAAFSPDGRLLALPSAGRLRDLRTGSERPLTGPGIAAGGLGPPAVFSPDGRLLAVAEPTDGHTRVRAVRVLEVLTGRHLAQVQADLGYHPPLHFSPDGRMLAAAGVEALHLWDARTGRPVLRLDARGRLTHWLPTRFASSLAFAPDGRALATGHDDGTILLWDLATAWKRLPAPRGPVDAADCWERLADADPGKAWEAVERLASVPGQAAVMFRKQLKPAAKVPPPEERRQIRAVAVLERIGSDEARALLREVAGGTADTPLTREARAALLRLSR